MNIGLFAMLVGFLLPLALVIRAAGLLAIERRRGIGHPLTLFLLIVIGLAGIPVVALTPSVWSVVSGRTIEDGASLLDFAATRWGLAKLAVTVAVVLLADAALPRLCEQLTRSPPSVERPTAVYLLRDLGVLATCLALACAASLHR